MTPPYDLSPIPQGWRVRRWVTPHNETLLAPIPADAEFFGPDAQRRAGDYQRMMNAMHERGVGFPHGE